MSKLKNKIVEAATSLLSSILRQEKMQDALSDSIGKYLLREDSQGHIDRVLDKYLLREDSQGHIDRVLDKYLLRDISRTVFCKAIAANQELQKLVWKASNVRPASADMHWASIPNSIVAERMRQATKEAAMFVQKNMPDIYCHKNPFEVINYCVTKIPEQGLCLEFGVFSGTTINHIAAKIGSHRSVHGFDSFEGIPERWGTVPAGQFSTSGKLPTTAENVELHVGWFDETLPKFLSNHKGNVAFVHIDSDLYSSAKTILWNLKDRLIPGSIILFDEFFNYPYWKEHEYKAFMEFIKEFDVKFEYIAFPDRGYSVAIRILK